MITLTLAGDWSSGISKRVAETTTCSVSASPGEGVGEVCCPKQMLGAKRSRAAYRIESRTRLACWRWCLAIADFFCATPPPEILALRKDRFGATPKPTRGTRALPGTNQTGRFRIQVTSNSESRTCMAEAASPSSHSSFCEEVFSVCVVAGIVDPGRRGHRPRLQPNEVDRTNILAPGFRSS